MRVFVADPGYSLKEALRQWKQGNFPGHVLYGVNYFEKFGCVPVFQKACSCVAEKSKGSSRRKVMFSRWKAEWNTIKELFFGETYDAVYLPLVNFSSLICVLRLVGVIQKPVVGLIHSVNYESRFKRLVYRIYYAALDQIIFIAENVKENSEKCFPQFKSKMIGIELMPEKPKADLDIEVKSQRESYQYDFCLIGKTNRDYKIASETAKKMKISGIIVGGVTCKQFENEYVKAVPISLPYRVCRNIYQQSKINLISLKEANGIYGLTSILDSFTNLIPMIVTKTSFLPIEIEKNGYGLEFSAGSEQELEAALKKLLHEDCYYKTCVENMKKRMEVFHSEIFAERICRILREMDFVKNQQHKRN